MFTRHVLLTDRLLETLADWQSAIDADGFPVRLQSVEGSLSSAALVRAELSDGPTTFRLDVSHPHDVVLPSDRPKGPERWRHAVTLSDTEGDLSGFTSTLAAIAYGERCGGVVYNPGAECPIVTQFDVIRRAFDEIIGVVLQQHGLAADPAHPYPVASSATATESGSGGVARPNGGSLTTMSRRAAVRSGGGPGQGSRLPPGSVRHRGTIRKMVRCLGSLG